MSELKDRYGIVVIGSGYGGSISAARLAAAGHELCVLERGREWAPGDFPDDLTGVSAEIRRDTRPLGLYDYCVTDQVDVLTGCGLGGTSLINANVLIRPDRDVLDAPEWPDEIRADRDSGRLNEYYERADGMLKGSPLPDDIPSVRKMMAHKKSAQSGPARFTKLNLAVNFDTYDNEPNHVGVYQKPCVLCGDCVTGCNVSSKNTLTMNYLPFAKKHGAFIFTAIEVNYITKAAGGGYFVHCSAHSGKKTGNKPTVLHAGVVILAAGTLGSTRILFNSRDRGLAVSDALGHHFSANGDLMGLGYNTDKQTDILGFGNFSDNRSKIRVGPTILSAADHRYQKNLQDRFIIEEGAIPRAFVDVLRMSLPAISGVAGYDTDFDGLDELSEAGRVIRDLAGYDVDGALNHSMLYLGMAHDGADGVIALNSRGGVRIDWETGPSKPIFQRISEEMKRLTAAQGGTYIRNPRWTPFFGRNVVTVHPLGGCVMGRNAGESVVDHRGRVFDPSQADPEAVHDGLFVFDGSVIPTSLGVNPLFTICALSERMTELLIADGSVDKAPRKGKISPPAPSPPSVGMEFTEEMKGYITDRIKDAKRPEDYREAERQGRQEGTALGFKLTIYVDDVDRFVTESTHRGRAEGYVTMGSSKSAIERGRFNLFIDKPGPKTKRMFYSLLFRGDGDGYCLMEGYKEIRDDPALDIWEIWRDMTTLFTTVYKGETPEGPVVGQGIIRVHLQDFLRQLTTFRVRNAVTLKARAEAETRFMSFFFGELWEAYVKNLILREA
ncbi:MAG: GMC family oxidoreductase [Proteobacteria bacterium]|nr:GMC family oxidoreductase [Pseudomonadota bacterium]